MNSRLISIAAAALMLGGCQMEVETRVYASDVLAASLDGEQLTTPVTIAFQVPTPQECTERAGALASALGQFDGSVRHVGCEERGFSHYAVFAASATIRRSEDKAEGGQTIVSLAVSPAEAAQCGDNPCRAVSIQVVPNHRFAEVRETVAGAVNNFLANQPIQRASLSTVVDNDMRDPLGLRVWEAFVDGRPVSVHDGEQIEITRRENVRVTLSDVATAIILDDRGYAGMVLTFAPD